MTRQRQKNEENKVIQVLLEHLSKNGKEIQYEPEEGESPDFRLFIEDKIIGCELTRITLQELEEWARGHGDHAENFQKEIVEGGAGKWMEELLGKKIPKIERYRENCHCDELWLVVHFGIIPLFGHESDHFETMKQMIQKIEHDFDKIWFVGEENDVRLLLSK